MLKWSEVKVTQSSCLTLWDLMGFTVHGILQARILEWIAFPFSRGSSQLRDRTQVSCIAGRFFTSRTTGKPSNTGMGSLSLLQRTFLTQELNWGLLHCRQILHKMSHKRSPRILKWVAYLFSSGPSWPRNWTGVCCIAGWFFISWAMSDPRERIKLAKIGLWPRKCWRLDWKSL